MTKVSLVIITRNRVGELMRTLDAVSSSGELDEVIVVDNGSCDGTVDLVRCHHPSVKLILAGSNLGAFGRNVALRHARNPYVAFCDDDTLWDSGSITRASEHLDNYERLGLVAGGYYIEPQMLPDPPTVAMSNSPLGIPSTGARQFAPGPRVVGFLAGASMVRRGAFIEAGGFHPRFGVGGEEELLAIDMRDSGWDLCFAPDVSVLHRPSQTRSSPWRRSFRVARNRQRVRILRYPLADAASGTAADLWRCLLRRRWSEIGGQLAALADLPWMLSERRIASNRTMSLIRCARNPGTPRHADTRASEI